MTGIRDFLGFYQRSLVGRSETLNSSFRGNSIAAVRGPLVAVVRSSRGIHYTFVAALR
jgi:hypothetical protein